MQREEKKINSISEPEARSKIQFKKKLRRWRSSKSVHVIIGGQRQIGKLQGNKRGQK